MTDFWSSQAVFKVQSFTVVSDEQVAMFGATGGKDTKASGWKFMQFTWSVCPFKEKIFVRFSVLKIVLVPLVPETA